MDIAILNSYIVKFEQQYKQGDDTIRWLVAKYPKNATVNHVLSKAAIINNLYNTHISGNDLIKIASFIVEQHQIIDFLIEQGNIEAVYEIGRTNKDLKNQFVFASKYCHFHNPEAFPIFDKYSRAALVCLNNSEHFFKKITENSLLEYKQFYKAINSFISKIATGYSYKQADEFLWLYGMEIKQ